MKAITVWASSRSENVKYKSAKNFESEIAEYQITAKRTQTETAQSSSKPIVILFIS
jgi:hypothetical protein